eukprot:scpid47853/ scgid29049/ 
MILARMFRWSHGDCAGNQELLECVNQSRFTGSLYGIIDGMRATEVYDGPLAFITGTPKCVLFSEADQRAPREQGPYAGHFIRSCVTHGLRQGCKGLCPLEQERLRGAPLE